MSHDERTEMTPQETENFERQYRRTMTCKMTEPEKFEEESRRQDQEVLDLYYDFFNRS